MFSTIRAKILIGCLALSALTGLLGAYAQWSERELGAIALRIYDRSFMGMSYLRSAQAGFLAATGGALDAGALPGVLEDLEVARGRAMSPQGVAATLEQARLVKQVIEAPTAVEMAAARAGFEHAVEVFAGDGFRYRRTVETLIHEQLANGLAALAMSLVVALGITMVLGRAIVPPVRRAVQVAQAIAGGTLDNVIGVVGRGETADLLRALGVMQGSIAQALGRIRTLLQEQAATHADVLSAQHARMTAALDNMDQGLCLFGSDGRLAVANRRFAAMFGAPMIGDGPDAVLAGSGLGALVAALPRGVAALEYDRADGSSISVSAQPVSGGGWVATFADVTERRLAAARLARAARHDSLTGLPNRLQLSERERAMREQGGEDRVALVCIGLDRFKGVNEAMGHDVGDAVLRAVADRLRACAGEQDLVVRTGGDEFVILQIGSSQPADAQALGLRIAGRMGTEIQVGARTLLVGASIGVAVAADRRMEGADQEESLLPCAALAMGRAKAAGRGTIRFFSAGMDAAMQDRRMLELDLQAALSAGQFEVFYQPLVQARGVMGFEALLRWRHPLRGLVSPADFIPIAEETGLIRPIGAWVMRQACQDAAGWPGTLKVAVNLSPVQFRGGKVPEEAAAALRLSGLEASRLELEITESSLLTDDVTVAETLAALQAQGIRIAMDDFGTGFSSLGYLLRFRFDKIKIDQSFVRGMLQQDDCRTIVRAVIGLGRSLGMAVNAEGVETEAEMTMLRGEGCTELQGYLFSRPRPAAQVADMLTCLGNGSIVVPTGRDRRIAAEAAALG